MEPHPDTGIVTPGVRAGRSGLDLLQGLLDGTIPAVPMHRAAGIALTAVAEGRAEFAATPDAAHRNLMGGIHGGWFATLLDSAMGCALFTTLPAGVDFTTLEMKLNIMRALAHGRPVTAHGTIRHRGRRTAVVEAEIRDGGKLIATATSTCLILEGEAGRGA